MTTLQPRNPDFRAFIERYAASQLYLKLLGVTLGRIEPGLVEFHVPFRADLGQQDGVVHGGVMGSLAEGAMGCAAATMVAAGANVVGAEYKVNLLAAGRGAAIISRGQVIKPGRRLVICRADVFAVAEDGTETLCAIAQGTMAVIDPPA